MPSTDLGFLTKKKETVFGPNKASYVSEGATTPVHTWHGADGGLCTDASATDYRAPRNQEAIELSQRPSGMTVHPRRQPFTHFPKEASTSKIEQAIVE